MGDTHPGFDIPGLGSLPSLVRLLFIERIVVNLALPAGRYKAVVCSQIPEGFHGISYVSIVGFCGMCPAKLLVCNSKILFDFVGDFISYHLKPLQDTEICISSYM